MGKSHPSTETNRTSRQPLTTLSPTSVPTKHVRTKLRLSTLSRERRHHSDRGKVRSAALTTSIPRPPIEQTKTTPLRKEMQMEIFLHPRKSNHFRNHTPSCCESPNPRHTTSPRLLLESASQFYNYSLASQLHSPQTKILSFHLSIQSGPHSCLVCSRARTQEIAASWKKGGQNQGTPL